ncbi:MAG: hypothetical protein WA359_11315 [Acidimicrobiales bacterium]
MDVRQTSLYSRAARRRNCERGVGMISTLAVVVVLGVIVTIVISNGTPSTPQTSLTGTSQPGGSTTTTGAQTVGSDAKIAAIQSCLTNYAIIESAVSAYESLQGSTPPAGSAWATSTSSGPILQSWPSDPPYYTLRWNGHVLSAIPEHGTASHGGTGTSTPPTGCHAA